MQLDWQLSSATRRHFEIRLHSLTHTDCVRFSFSTLMPWFVYHYISNYKKSVWATKTSLSTSRAGEVKNCRTWSWTVKHNQGNHSSHGESTARPIIVCYGLPFWCLYISRPQFSLDNDATVCLSVVTSHTPVGSFYLSGRSKAGTWPDSMKERKGEAESLRPVKGMKTKLTCLQLLQEGFFLINTQ